VWTAIAFSLFLTATAASASGPLPDEPHIYVEGHHTETVEPDRYSIRISIAEVAPTSSEAATSVSSRLVQLFQKAEALGVPESAIRAFQVKVGPAHEWHDGQRQTVGTRVTRELEFSLKDITITQRLLDMLIASNIAEINSARASSSREESVRQAAIEAAVLHAKSRAEHIAKSLGAELGKVHSVSEFEQHYRPTQLTAFTGYAADMAMRRSAPFKPGPVDVTASVYVVFLLKN
jgi:uncharacterized protein YggE